MSLLRELFPVLQEIIDWQYIRVYAAQYSRRPAADQLLYAGDPGTQLTWMDAKYNDWVVTPRISVSPLEVNALWYNALSAISRLFAQRVGE